MKKYLFSIGNVKIPGYGLMIGIGFILALIVSEFRAKRKGLNNECVLDMAIIAIVSGFLGAKLLFVIVNFREFIDEPLSFLGNSGFVVYGGIILGVLCCILYSRIKKINFLKYFDMIMPGVAIAQGFGRIGCFLAGCCYGRQTDLPIGVIFPEGSFAPSGIKLIPTQLISAAGDFVIAAVLIIIADVLIKERKSAAVTEAESGKDEAEFADKENDSAGFAQSKQDGAELVKKENEDSAGFAQSKQDGNIGYIYLCLYGVGRFIIEFFRNDYRGTVGILSTSQFISLFIVAVGIILFAVNQLRARKYKAQQ